MRASILNPIVELRRGESSGKLRALRVKALRRGGDVDGDDDDDDEQELALAHLHAAEAGEIVASRASEAEVARVRAAGGPLDRAVYTCSCGFYFDATVSTAVPCPHCGTEQAW